MTNCCESVDTCGGGDEWMEKYFQNMCEGKMDKNIINQQGRGIGKSRRGKAWYKIPNMSGGARPVMISPVEQSIVQAEKKSAIKRKRSRSASHSSKGRGATKKKKKGNKKKKKKKKNPAKKQKTKKKPTKKKSRGKNKIVRQKDIFGKYD